MSNGYGGVDDYLEKTYTFSSLDKLNWPNKIEMQMWICIRTRGVMGLYDKEVKRLESCVGTDFSGLNFNKPINDNVKKLNIIKNKKIKTFIKDCDDGVFYHPKSVYDLTFRDRDLIKRRIYEWYWDERFNFVRDLFASHRGLLWGKTKLSGGTQMED